jgi:hypothetical protein
MVDVWKRQQLVQKSASVQNGRSEKVWCEGSVVNWHTLVGGDVMKSERGYRGSCCTTGDALEGLTTTNATSDSCLVKASGY